VSQFTIYVTPAALKEMKQLPGRVRQRVRRAVKALADQPHPPKSKTLDVAGLACEVCRLRIDHWRILYAVTEQDQVIDVLAVRKRPPYDYQDLAELLKDYPSA
jgi:mRNA interferase RelE/StbE